IHVVFIPSDLAGAADCDRRYAVAGWTESSAGILSAGSAIFTVIAIAESGDASVRQRSITGPLIMVVIGVLFLLNNLGREIPLWQYAADYWPFLLIAIGVIGLVEVLFHAGRGNVAPPRPFGGGSIFWI